MVYYGRRYKFRKYPKKKFSGKRRGVRKLPAKSVARLSRQVARVSKELARKRVPLYLVNGASSQTTNIQSPCTIQKLCKFSDDTAIFGTDPNDLLGSKVLLKNITLKIDVNLENLSETEEETQHLEMFIVQLRDIANDIFNPANGDITMTPNIHYWQFGGVNAGYTYLNTKYFKIIKHKRFMLTNYGSQLTTSGAQNLDGTNFRYDCKLKLNQIIHAGMSNSSDQTWKTLVCPRDPSQNYYILWFNDNSPLDGEFPRCNTLALKKFEKLDN